MTVEKHQDILLREWLTLLQVLYRDLFDFFNEMNRQNLDARAPETLLLLFDESGVRAKLTDLQQLQLQVDVARHVRTPRNE